MQKLEILPGYDKLRFIKEEPNEAAHQLVVDYFRVPFERPTRFIDTPYNRVALVANALAERNFALAFRSTQKSLGCWDPVYNSYRVKKDGDILIDVHEEVHSFTDQLNPNLTNGAFNLVLSLSDPEENFDPEQAIIYGALHEGIAYFAEMDIALYMGNRSVYGKAFEIKEAFLHNRAGSVSCEDESFSWLDLMRFNIESLKDASIKSPKEMERLMQEAFIRQITIDPFVGFPYVFHRVAALRQDHQLTDSEALVHIINNPPTTINEMES